MQVEQLKQLLIHPTTRATLTNINDGQAVFACGNALPVILGNIIDARQINQKGIEPRGENKIINHFVDNYKMLSLSDMAQANYNYGLELGWPKHLLDLYHDWWLRGEAREAERDELYKKLFGIQVTDGDVFLDIGAGTGPAMMVARKYFKQGIAIEPKLRDLIICKKRCENAGLDNIAYICGYGENIPLNDGCVDKINATDVIEHVNDPSLLLSEISRVLKFQGRFIFSTPNRYTLKKEGHVKLWGVGFLPKMHQGLYVKYFAKRDYDATPLSYKEIKRLGKKYFTENEILSDIDIEVKIYKQSIRFKILRIFGLLPLVSKISKLFTGAFYGCFIK